MSTNLKKIDKLKFVQHIEVNTTTNKELSSILNIEKKSRSKVASIILLSNEILWNIGKLRVTYGVSATDILNHNLPHNVSPIKENSSRFELSLLTRISEAKSKIETLKGRKRYEFMAKQIKLVVFNDECQDAHEIIQTKEKKAQTIISLENKVLKLSKEIADLQRNINILNRDNEQYKETLEKFVDKNTQLNSTISELTKNFENKGKRISSCAASTVRRKVRTLKDNVQKALWFADSFGVKFSSIKVLDDSGKEFDLMKDNQPSQFVDLCEEDKAKVKSLLYLLDTFGISDEAYHEISLRNSSMIRSYLVKQCRENINKTIIISQTPGPCNGAQMSLPDVLDKLIIENLSNGKINSAKDCEKPVVGIKFSADGAKVSRLSNFIVFSMAVLNCGQEVMSCNGYHTLAIVDGTENFVSIKESFRDLIRDINELLKRGENGNIPFTTSNGIDVNLEIFVGGDMKFLLLVCGLNAANSKHSCLYCKVDKKDRGDMSKPEHYYSEGSLIRTIEQMKLYAGKKASNFGCIHPPLIHIDLNHIVIDELHLMMRVVDVLLRNIIEETVNKDQKEKIRGPVQNSEKNKNLNELVNAIKQCGVSFSVWETKMKDGRGDYLKNLEWTSLTGGDMKKLLHYLPEKLSTVACFQSEVAREMVVELWKNFKSIYGVISAWSPSDTDIETYFEKANDWALDFLRLSKFSEGYDRKSVTPYMHIMIYHVPYFLKKYRSLKQFTGQGVEKVNDDIKLIYHRKTNRHNTTEDALRVRARKNLNRNYARIKRKYLKKNDNFWKGRKRQRVERSSY